MQTKTEAASKQLQKRRETTRTTRRKYKETAFAHLKVVNIVNDNCNFLYCERSGLQRHLSSRQRLSILCHMGLKKQENIHIQGDNFKERNNY